MLKTTVACTLLLAFAAAAPCLGEEQMLATSFIWPVLMDGVSDPRMNTVNLKAESDAQCVDGFWTSHRNDFGNEYCDHGLPGCGPNNCYHPGEDWNACPWGTNEAGEVVYAVANGKVVRTGSLGGNGSYLTIEHSLVQPESAAGYVVTGTTVNEPTSFDVVYSSYLHIDNLLVAEDSIVVKGQPIARISSCCSHLHFELTRRPMTSASNCQCGYCTSKQELTNVGYIHPTRYIRDHLEDLSASPLGSPLEGRLEVVGPPGAFDAAQGTISARICPENVPSCHLNPQIVSWEADRITIDLQEQVTVPVTLEIRRHQGQLVGVLSYPFVDVTPSTWYGEVTTKAWQAGLVKGNGRGFFAPDVRITRAEFVEMLAKISGAICGGSCVTPPFSDVLTEDWFYDSVRLAYSFGWITGSGAFRPRDPINRAEAAAILVRASACAEVPYPIANPYADVSDSSVWFYEAVYQAREFEMMTGYRKGIACNGAAATPEQRFFCPAQEITRAEALKAMFSWFTN